MSTKSLLDDEGRRALYAAMVRVRLVEETIAARYSEQEMRCPVHLSVGQEAVAAGVCATLDRSDVVVSTHRCHAHYLAKGGSLKAMIAEIYGRATGCGGGRGGSMHLFDDEAGMKVSVPIVSSSIPLGVGMALALKQQGSNKASVIFLGDASLEEGVFHESMNFAVVKQLPVLFVCENNLYSVYTALGDRQPPRPLIDVAKAHAMPARHEDGNDVEAIHDAAMEAVGRARNGQGPSFLVFDTYRWLEHCGSNYDNDLGYRNEAEFEQWKELCPVDRYRQVLEEAGLWDGEKETALNDEIRREIDDAFWFALDSPFPEPETANENVYA